MTPPDPLVTLAFPLYRSARFHDVIARNLEGLDDPSYEILVSDRHMADDTLDRLERRFGGDPRIRFLRATDRAGWVEHYNALLAAASGRYLAWMPHDDTYPPGYVAPLVAALEAYPDSLLAFGDAFPIGPDGEALGGASLPPRPPERWGFRHALTLPFRWQPGHAFRGVLRRDRLVSERLFLRAGEEDGYAADVFWVFAVALRGPLLHVPESVCWKRLYADSTHRRWEERMTPARRVRRFAANRRVLASYLRDYGPAGPRRLVGLVAMTVWAAALAISPLFRFGRRRSLLGLLRDRFTRRRSTFAAPS